ncbi:hypothetical protein [Actinacidiphila sp. ITFR-21]|uniref:hypothetical protein n=1 Tax=Actinacidiphila sp. ITFR-21 TaxID=3075199 RepID=UPI00288AC743|nr:hypothetical protein [Streptomyces sp. ITFR-21]WNI17692.1 hypothetical protein RLT57_20595 [Streptomyces sp. ITFR-21]WNI17832.1 hypothetical protein RLT57_21310 [Streptomyces sp. ITFR-21]
MQDKLVTDEEVYTFVETIPRTLADCLSKGHHWVAYDWHGWNAKGHEVRNPRNAVAIDKTQRCDRCDMLRHTTLTVGRRGPIDRTEFTYSHRHPALVSPVGVSQTGISVRREVGMNQLWGEIVDAPTPLRSSQETKEKSARGAA